MRFRNVCQLYFFVNQCVLMAVVELQIYRKAGYREQPEIGSLGLLSKICIIFKHLHFVVWQARSNNYRQYLQVDLSRRRLITRVATQGYRGSGQFVVDYHISYSNDNTTFTSVVNDLGEPEVRFISFYLVFNLVFTIKYHFESNVQSSISLLKYLNKFIGK